MATEAGSWIQSEGQRSCGRRFSQEPPRESLRSATHPAALLFTKWCDRSARRPPPAHEPQRHLPDALSLRRRVMPPQESWFSVRGFAAGAVFGWMIMRFVLTGVSVASSGGGAARVHAAHPQRPSALQPVSSVVAADTSSFGGAALAAADRSSISDNSPPPPPPSPPPPPPSLHAECVMRAAGDSGSSSSSSSSSRGSGGTVPDDIVLAIMTTEKRHGLIEMLRETWLRDVKALLLTDAPGLSETPKQKVRIWRGHPDCGAADRGGPTIAIANTSFWGDYKWILVSRHRARSARARA